MLADGLNKQQVPEISARQKVTNRPSVPSFRSVTRHDPEQRTEVRSWVVPQVPLCLHIQVPLNCQVDLSHPESTEVQVRHIGVTSCARSCARDLSHARCSTKSHKVFNKCNSNFCPRCPGVQVSRCVRGECERFFVYGMTLLSVKGKLLPGKERVGDVVTRCDIVDGASALGTTTTTTTTTTRTPPGYHTIAWIRHNSEQKLTSKQKEQ